MSILCDLKIHDWVKQGKETETNEKDKGACIETWRETFNHYKCKRCGETKKKLNRKREYRGGKKKDREMIKREWKQ